MERAPKQEVGDKYEIIEVDGWRQLVEVAPAEAEDLIADIDGFAEMEVPQQIAELQMLLERLSSENDKRYVAEQIAQRLTALHATKEYADTMNRLGRSRNGSNLSVAI